MTPERYTELVGAALSITSDAAYNRPATGMKGKPTRHNSTPRQKKRSHWVTEDDILAHRRYEEEPYNTSSKRHKWHYNNSQGSSGGRGNGRGGNSRRGEHGGGRGDVRGGRGGQQWRGYRGQSPYSHTATREVAIAATESKVFASSLLARYMSWTSSHTPKDFVIVESSTLFFISRDCHFKGFKKKFITQFTVTTFSNNNACNSAKKRGKLFSKTWVEPFRCF
jgi:hypothetical protein